MNSDQYRMMMETLTDMSEKIASIRSWIVIIGVCIVAFMTINLFLMGVDDDDDSQKGGVK